jgi:hypothetical protein
MEIHRKRTYIFGAKHDKFYELQKHGRSLKSRQVGAIPPCQSFSSITNIHSKVAENFLYSFRLSNACVYSVDRTDTRTAELISLRFYYANTNTETKWDSHDAAKNDTDSFSIFQL